MQGQERKFVFEKLTCNMAYVIGVYMGDGWIHREDEFGLFSVDKEFVECTKRYVDSFMGPTPDIRPRTYSSGFNGKGASGWNYTVGSRSFCRWLRDITKSKSVVPDIIPVAPEETSKNFCEGFLDSEGWVSKTRDAKNTYGTHWYRCGMCNNNINILTGVMTRLELIGVRHNKIMVITGKDRVHPNYSCPLVIRDVVKAGINFRIRRKAERLQEYRSLNVTKPWNKGLTKQQCTEKIGTNYMHRNDLLND